LASSRIASGLKPNWAAAAKTQQRIKKKDVDRAAGGIDDDAAQSTRPDFPPSPSKVQDRDNVRQVLGTLPDKRHSRVKEVSLNSSTRHRD
jgi:hypothetical protein